MMETAVERLFGWYGELNRSLTWWMVIKYGVLLLLTRAAYVILIKPYLSPLMKIPGLPYIPLMGNMKEYLKGQAIEQSVNLHKRFGMVFRYYFFGGHPRIQVCDPKLFKRIMGTHSKIYAKPMHGMRVMKWLMGKHNIISMNGMEHLHKRRIMNPAFSYASIKKMIPTIVEKALYLRNKWFKQIANEKSGLTDCEIQTDVTMMTLDSIGEAAFGFKFDSLRGSKNMEVGHAFNELLKGYSLEIDWMFLACPWYEQLPFKRAIKIRHYLSVVDGAINEVVARKKELLLTKGEEGKREVSKDLLGIMMTQQMEDGNEFFTSEELRDHAFTFMLAGHETVTTSVCWVLLCLAQNQEIQDKLREELRANIPEDADSSWNWQQVENLKYLEAVMKESMRLYPAIPIVLRVAAKDDYLGGYFIPKGTMVECTTAAMMRRPEVWPEPLSFIPERFLNNTNIDPYTWVPFVQGSRMCIGYKFALLEMRLTMAILLRDIKFTQIPGTSYRRKHRITMRPDPALCLRAERAP